MRQRGVNSWNLRVYAGRDPNTGRKLSVERTVRGNKREASKVLAAMVAEVDQRPVGSLGKGTVAALCREWLAHATPSFSPKTVETTRMYIEDPIVPVLGPIPVAKLTPADLDVSTVSSSRSVALADPMLRPPSDVSTASSGGD